MTILVKTSKKIAALLGVFALLMIPQLGFAQGEAANQSAWPKSQQEWLFMFLVALILIVAVLLLVVSIYTVNILQIILNKQQEKAGVKVSNPVNSWWKNLDQQLTNAIPLSKEKDIMLDHNYDGIRELDNHLPPWWLYLFYGSTAYALIYLLFAHVWPVIPMSEAEYVSEVKVAEEQIAEYKKLAANSIDETNVQFVESEAEISAGKSIFDAKCASCHGNAGEGGIGPNLTDKYWIHGGSIGDIFKTIKYGVPQKGMISWEKEIKPGDMQNIASYIMTLQGTNPPNAKEPQGDEYSPEENAGNTDKNSSSEQVSLK